MTCIDSFRNEYAFLSNYFDSPVKFEGHIYPTVEHAYQAAKTFDPEERAQIRKASTPGQAKKLGNKVKLRPDWEGAKVGIMEALLRDKFSNSVLHQRLLDTGDVELVEGNTWNDTFWGVDAQTGRGKNWLGRLLMQIRKEATQ